MADDRSKNSIEIYKLFASGSEMLAERRRAYTAAFLAFLAAIAIAPYALTTDSSNPRALGAIAASSAVGFIISRYWQETSERFRIFIVYRQRWLSLMEQYLSAIPDETGQPAIYEYARVYSFQVSYLYNTDGEIDSPNAGLSAVDATASLLFKIFFLISPAIYCCSLYLWNCVPEARKALIFTFLKPASLTDGLNWVVIGLAIWGVAALILLGFADRVFDSSGKMTVKSFPWDTLVDGDNLRERPLSDLGFR
jgi:hypothetical protein